VSEDERKEWRQTRQAIGNTDVGAASTSPREVAAGNFRPASLFVKVFAVQHIG